MEGWVGRMGVVTMPDGSKSVAILEFSSRAVWIPNVKGERWAIAPSGETAMTFKAISDLAREG